MSGMILSLSRHELFEYINGQTEMYFPDKCIQGGDNRAFDLALDRLEYCFQHIKVKGYQEDGQAKFYHLHMDQYSAFLYYYANSIWKLGGNTAFADKLILLNRALSGMWFSYKNNLPDIFLFVHPVGTVLGNANYSDYLVVLQNVTVNTMVNETGNLQPNIGKGCYLTAGAKVIGNGRIGDWCTVGVDTVLHNTPLSNKNLAYNDANGKLIIKEHDNLHIMRELFVL